MKARLKSLVDLITSCDSDTVRPYLALEHVEGGTGRLLPDIELPERSTSKSGAAAVEVGDVLFGKLRPYLAKTWLSDRPVFASTELLCLRPRSTVDARWLGYVCASRPLVEWAVATSDGSKMPRTGWEKLSEYRLEIPPVDTQRTISNLLDSETSRINALIVKKRQMLQLLTERSAGIVEQGVRDLAERHGEHQRLKTMVRDITVGIVVKPSVWYSDQGVPALRGLNVRPHMIDFSDLVKLSAEGDRVHAKSKLRAGDVVVVRTGQAGAAAVVPPALDGANCIDLLIVRPGSLDAKFLTYVLNSDWTHKHISKYSVGTIQSHFNVSSLVELPIPAAPLDEQRRFVLEVNSQLSRLEAIKAKLSNQLELLCERRQALITAVVTGEMDVLGVSA